MSPVEAPNRGRVKPTAANTGAKGMLASMNGATITTPGLVIKNVRISGTLKIRAPNVRVQNFVLDVPTSDYGIECEVDTAPGLILEDGEVLNPKSTCVYGRNLTARRLHLHESFGDAMKLHGNALVEACFIEKLGRASDAHADGNQSRMGIDLTFRGNNINVPIDVPGHESNSALLFSAEAGVVREVLVYSNWLNGGNYTVWFDFDPNHVYGDFGKPTLCSLINNRFGRDFRYGPLVNNAVDTVISGNRWADTGALMDINND